VLAGWQPQYPYLFGMRRIVMPWLYRKGLDVPFILLPPFFITLWVLALPGFFHAGPMPPWFWLLFVVGIDVAHVYSTLYRTYLDRRALGRRRLLFVLVPPLAWLGGMLLYSAGAMVFWRVLAYLAVFHFVRQQYGFYRLYARAEHSTPWGRRLEAATIYMTTLYPLLYWHSHLPRPFSWFMEGDFVVLPLWVGLLAGWVYLGLLLLYGLRLVRRMRQGIPLNVPRELVLLGTALSWYVGIVWAQGDMAFTAINVVSHGIPYMALIWAYGRRQGQGHQQPPAYWFRYRALPVFLLLLLLLAYAEEVLWDGLVWRDHPGLFSWIGTLPQLTNPVLLGLLVPLLAVPQATHYLLDGFIWRRGTAE
jgi:hypothetical protein